METAPLQVYIEDLIEKYDHFMLDWDGVLYSGSHSISGSPEAIKMLRENNKKLYYITNTSGRTQKSLQEKLESCGIEFDKKAKTTPKDAKSSKENSTEFESQSEKKVADDVDLETNANNWYSSSVSTSLYLKQKYPEVKKVFVIGEQGCVDQLTQSGIEWIGGEEDPQIYMTGEEYENYKLDPEVGAVIVGFDRKLNYRKISLATLYIQNGRHFIAWNDDMYDMVKGRPIPTTGVTLKTLEYTTKKTPFVWGKPNPVIFSIISEQYNFTQEDKARSIMIGDRLSTDIGMAQNSGIDSLLVLSGWNTLEHINDKNENPDGFIPTYVMPKLGHFKESKLGSEN